MSVFVIATFASKSSSDEVVAPKVVLGFKCLDASLEFIRRELLNPFNPKLCFFRPTLQTYGRSGLQLRTEGTKPRPDGVMSIVCARPVTLPTEILTGKTILRRCDFLLFST